MTEWDTLVGASLKVSDLTSRHIDIISLADDSSVRKVALRIPR